MLDTAEKNKIKPDTILKNFWRDNRHFADLFNAVFFNGEQVLKPQDLTEADTDVSSMLKFNGHAETVQKSVVVPLEEALNGVENMMYMTSSSTNNGSALSLIHI